MQAEMQSLIRASIEEATGTRKVMIAARKGQCNHKVITDGQIMTDIAHRGASRIFLQGHIAAVMQAVLNAPVTASGNACSVVTMSVGC